MTGSRIQRRRRRSNPLWRVRKAPDVDEKPPVEAERRWKGKSREVIRRDEGSGNQSGIVLPLELVGTTVYDYSYSLPVLVGSGDNQQNLSLQVDTGSSDLWIASTSCSSQSCSSTDKYNPSSATQTGDDFSINYLSGNVSGPIVWDTVVVGGYSIDNQALAAATTVDNEALTDDFSGILGLALPMNSIIAQKIPPGTSNAPDGAAFASNLFSITPIEQAPSSKFISLSLNRPGSDTIPALLGIGLHPSELVSDPSQVTYGDLVSDEDATLFWKADVQAITVWENGVPKSVQLGRSLTGGVYPTAVLDTGVPIILTTSAIADGIYGAMGVSPDDSGQYYLPCTTPLNMTITIDGYPPIYLHPLDLTTPPPNDPSSTECIGIIQTADSALRASTEIGDMILGIPFLRNVYTVMAYEPPDSSGNFASDDTNISSASMSNDIHPMLGLMALTNPTTAMEEFHQVRVLNQPLQTNPTTIQTPTHGMSVGIKALIGLMSFFGLCIALFGLRFFMARRSWRKKGRLERTDSREGYMLARSLRGPTPAVGSEWSEDTLRTANGSAKWKKARTHSELTTSTTGTAMTLADIEDEHNPSAHALGEELNEYGFKKVPVRPARPVLSLNLVDVDPGHGWTATRPPTPTLDEREEGEEGQTVATVYSSPEDIRSPETPTFAPEELNRALHHRAVSVNPQNQAVAAPLLAHVRDGSVEIRSPPADLAEFGQLGMAGVGTAVRGNSVEPMRSRGPRIGLGGVRERSGRIPLGPRTPSVTNNDMPFFGT